MTRQSNYWIEHLGLKAHPEGGYYKEVYRAELVIEPTGFAGKRNICTGIYFLLEAGQFSALHRIKSDEIWHFYDGQAVDIFTIDPSNDSAQILRLGLDIEHGEQPMHIVKAGHWFGALPAFSEGYALVGCTVAPGFDFMDFEMPDRAFFVNTYPQHRHWIERLTRL